jgi:hypothetical protein
MEIAPSAAPALACGRPPVRATGGGRDRSRRRLRDGSHAPMPSTRVGRTGPAPLSDQSDPTPNWCARSGCASEFRRWRLGSASASAPVAGRVRSETTLAPRVQSTSVIEVASASRPPTTPRPLLLSPTCYRPEPHRHSRSETVRLPQTPRHIAATIAACWTAVSASGTSRQPADRGARDGTSGQDVGEGLPEGADPAELHSGIRWNWQSQDADPGVSPYPSPLEVAHASAAGRASEVCLRWDDPTGP